MLLEQNKGMHVFFRHKSSNFSSSTLRLFIITSCIPSCLTSSMVGTTFLGIHPSLLLSQNSLRCSLCFSFCKCSFRCCLCFPLGESLGFRLSTSFRLSPSFPFRESLSSSLRFSLGFRLRFWISLTFPSPSFLLRRSHLSTCLKQLPASSSSNISLSFSS